jgi:hypothetical protein
MSTSSARNPQGGVPPDGNGGAAGEGPPLGGAPCTWNSSITRVRPFFRALFANDPTGQGWLPKLLRCATENQQYAAEIAAMPGQIFPEMLLPRAYRDDCWRNARGIEAIELEACFESSKLPPERLLLWLINHPEGLDHAALPAGAVGEAAHWRGLLLGQDATGIETAKAEARRKLNQSGVSGAIGWWWAFEGPTEVDCCLETERLVVFFEGKRLENLSPRTRWMPIRNQLWRNLDAAANAAATMGKRYAVMLLAETCETVCGFDASLPHIGQEERDFLRGHYLGCVTWQEACQATGVGYDDLPETIGQAVP